MSLTINDSVKKIAQEAPTRLAFFQAFLRFAGSQTDALSGIAWNCSATPFQPISQIQSRDREVLKIGISEQVHLGLIHQTLALTPSKTLVSKPRPDASGQIPFEHPVIMMAALRTKSATGRPTVQLIELFFPQGLVPRVYEEHANTLEALSLIHI